MAKSKSLKSLISHSYLTSSVLPILMIELLLLLLYFGINSYMTSQNKKALLAEVSLSLQEISKHEVASINSQLNEVARCARIVQRDQQRFFAHPERCILPNSEPAFGYHANGAYYKLTNNSGSSLYYSSTTPIGPTEARKALCTEAFDPLLADIVITSPIITQAYFNSWDNMNRLYPFMPDAPGQYGPVLNMQDYNFYFAADATHNPDRNTVWTSAYLDPAGQGWMISNVVPIYNGNFLEGVSGLDVTIDSFIQHILTLKLPWESKVLMVDRDGVILAMQEQVEKLLGLKELKKHDYQSNILETVQKPDKYNILKNSDQTAPTPLKNLFLSKEKIAQLDIAGTGYLASQEIIPETGWRMIALVNKASIFAQIYRLENQAQRIGYLAIGIMVLFYIIFFVVLQRKAEKLSVKIARPIEQLSFLTNEAGTNMDYNQLEQVGIDEIDKLNRNYNIMVDEIEQRTNDLIEIKLREKIIERETELLSSLAETDQLTGLANRYKLDKALNFELDRFKRTKRPFGVIIIDLDHFKTVNDSFGHQIGDHFLSEISQRLQKSIRKTDLVGRWGGDEFLIICPEINQSALLEKAEKLRKVIEDRSFTVIGNKTASLGVAISQFTDQQTDLIGRADKALYDAKLCGRNCVSSLNLRLDSFDSTEQAPPSSS